MPQAPVPNTLYCYQPDKKVRYFQLLTAVKYREVDPINALLNLFDKNYK